MAKKTNWRKWLPKSIKPKMTGNGSRQMRDGEPDMIRLTRWPNDRTLHAQQWVVCCDCGLAHVYTYEIVRVSDDEWWLSRRAYRVPGDISNKGSD